MSNIIDTLRSINEGSFKNDEEKKLALTEVYGLMSRLESIGDTMVRLVLTTPVQMVALKVALDLGLFSQWIEMNDGSDASIDELSSLVKCDPELLRRLVRHLAATNMIWVDAQGRYKMTPFTKCLVTEDVASAIDHYFFINGPLTLQCPAFFQATGYVNPDGKDVDCFKHWKGQSLWEHIVQNPHQGGVIMGRYMKATAKMRGDFPSIYPGGDLSCDSDKPLIVDVGGNVGHDLQHFRSAHPNATGRLIVQDTPKVIDAAKKNLAGSNIEAEVHDFFTPQPIKGAQIYLLRAVLHDWPDSDAKRILENLRPALKPGYSKLLVHEVVIADVMPDVESTSRDLTMLTHGSGLERTEAQWKSMLGSTGFKIKKIWRNPVYVEAVIEAELA